MSEEEQTTSGELTTISINALDLAANQEIKIEEKRLNQDTNSVSSSIENKSTTSLNTNNEFYNEQEISRLRDLIKQKESDYCNLELKLNELETQSRSQIEQLHLSLNSKLEDALKKIQESQKDKNSMVMKYVEVERKCIELNKTITLTQTKLNDSLKDKQRLIEKLEKFKLDFDKINSENDKKLKELTNQKKEIEKLKEQLILSDAREKAAQLKLKTELDQHQITKSELEEVKKKLTSIPQDLNEQIPQDSVEHLKPADAELTEPRPISPNEVNKKQTNIEIEKLKKELSVLNSQLKDMFEERTTLRDRVKCLEQERSAQEANLNKFKETLQSQKQLNKDLLNENLQLREHQETWTKDLEEKKELEQKLKLYTTELNDLQLEMSKNQEKQNELLLFTSKLTEKNTQLQSENSNLSEKLEYLKQELEKSNTELNQSNSRVKTEIENLRIELNERLENCDKLKSELLEKTKQVEEFSTKLADEQDENATLKKKHAANIKDLTRQLQTLQKKLNQQQTVQTPTIQENLEVSMIKPSLSYTQSLNLSGQNSVLHKGSRTSSLSSLNEIHDDTSSINSNNLLTNSQTPVTTFAHSYNNEVICGASVQDDVYVVDIDKQKIIEKIVKLQKTLAKRNEKIDFLQDHVNQLTNDLKRKTKIIQAYAMNEDVGAFTSEAQDAIKREMSRKTGIMSTLYNTNKSYIQTTSFISTNENNMTMDLCLEINRKLQALLEDTLMKNLTLKESLETLGQEIAKLSKENRDLKLNFK